MTTSRVKNDIVGTKNSNLWSGLQENLVEMLLQLFICKIDAELFKTVPHKMHKFRFKQYQG